MKNHYGGPIYIITFPGAVLHAIWHKLICRLFLITINEEDILNFKRNTTYVIHEKSDNRKFNILVTYIPFILNSIIGIIMLISVSIEFLIFKLFDVIISGGVMWANAFDFAILIFSCWFGFSILMHSIPSGKKVNKFVNLAINGTFEKNSDIPFIGSPYVAHISFVGIIYASVILASIPIMLKYVFI